MVLQRKILFISGSRGEYGYIRPLLRMIDKDKYLTYEIVITNMHVLEEFGSSEEEFTKDNFRIYYKIFNTISGYNAVTMPKSLGIFLLQIPEIILASKPDIILIAGDRGEMLMTAITGCHMNIPVAHIQAGEVSGNIDGNIRHAITKVSHIHFASNKDAYQRVLDLGEEPFRVFEVGAPLVDELINKEFICDNVYDIYNINKDKPMVMFVYHPVTEEVNYNYSHVHTVLEAINSLGTDFGSVVVILPNSDAGRQDVERAICNHTRSNYHIFNNLPRSHYLGFLKKSSFIIGNSTSGLMEAPSFGIPAINIGRRQLGRVHGSNVINILGYDKNKIINAIKKASSKEFKKQLEHCVNPYGDGNSASRIINILKTIKIDENLILKRITF